MRYIVDPEAFTIQPLDARGNPEGAAHSWFEHDGFNLLSVFWTQASWQRRYSYQFRWLGRPIIQLPQDVMLVQDLIWRTRPSVIVETGIAHGGSVVLHASLLKMIHASSERDRPHVLAIDIEIRPENREALEAHPLRAMYTLVEASSIDPQAVARVRSMLRPHDRVMVVLDSNHGREHVLQELRAYAPLVTPGCCVLVMDGVMPLLAGLPAGQRQWTHDHPAAAIDEFLLSAGGGAFEVDRTYEGYALTHSPGGILMRCGSDAGGASA